MNNVFKLYSGRKYYSDKIKESENFDVWISIVNKRKIKYLEREQEIEFKVRAGFLNFV